MRAPNSATSWDIGLSSWIIQDGNYPDFQVGEASDFALEFWLPPGAKAAPSAGVPCTQNLGDAKYDTRAEIIVHSGEITILDIGVLAFGKSSLLRSVPKGSQVSVRLGLGVDPFFYFEDLSTRGDIPPLIYSWKILSILRQTAPFIERHHEADSLIASKTLVRNSHQLGYAEVIKTDAWHDDDGVAEYLLQCDRLPSVPKRERGV